MEQQIDKPHRRRAESKNLKVWGPQSFAGRMHRLRRMHLFLMPRFDDSCAEESYRRFAGRGSGVVRAPEVSLGASMPASLRDGEADELFNPPQTEC